MPLQCFSRLKEGCRVRETDENLWIQYEQFETFLTRVLYWLSDKELAILIPKIRRHHLRRAKWNDSDAAQTEVIDFDDVLTILIDE